MHDALLLIHSIVRWFVLAGLLGVLVAGAVEMSRGEGLTPGLQRLFTIAVGLLDLQVTIGLLLWVVAGAWNLGVFRAYIHPAGMILALAVAHIGVSRAKAGQSTRAALVGLLVSLVLIVISIPRDAWF